MATNDVPQTWLGYDAATANLSDLDRRVHVWRVGLDVDADRFAATLSGDERERADRLVWPDHRRQFTAARGVLRAILADLMGGGVAPHALRLGKGPAGKPFLIDDPGLHVSVSHCDDVALIAATRVGEVGVDIERQRPFKEMAAIADLLFDESEKAAMLGGPPATRETAFFRIWTRKEALLKALGVGMAGLEHPEAVSFGLATRALHVTRLPPIEGFVTALAHPRAISGIRSWSWPDPIGSAAGWGRSCDAGAAA